MRIKDEEVNLPALKFGDFGNRPLTTRIPFEIAL